MVVSAVVATNAAIRTARGTLLIRPVCRRTVSLAAGVAALPPRSYIRSDLVGNLQRRVSGVSAARVDVDNDIVPVRQRPSTAPAGGPGMLLSRGGTQCAVRVGDQPDRPLRPALRVGVLAAARPLLGGGIEEGTGFFHDRK